ncbi:MAG: biotin--[acetyl-CoA-carboxylase] ligase [Actinobacteria bacterium]|jgi:BirA family biotin operon repressor/biotin-[acetyl-CoA-carboxylase] ligase|nr:MAG: biotin--[acetyl-CoA-carboxylase] ligase [Actinomycetota bacterium]
MEWDVRSFESIDSTNLEAKRLLDAGASSRLVVTARHQTGGRGRMGRTWLDLPGKSLLVSTVLADLGGFESAMLVALSARAAIVASGGEGPLLKWPNDLVYGDRKAGGVLCEVYAARNVEYVIAGLGLNVGYLPGELDLPTKLKPTSLLIEEGRIWDNEELLVELLHELETRLRGDRVEWWSEYRRNLAFMGEAIRVDPPFAVLDERGFGEGIIEGFMRGVDDGGNVLLEVEGRTLRLAAGDMRRGGGGNPPCGS